MKETADLDPTSRALPDPLPEVNEASAGEEIRERAETVSTSSRRGRGEAHPAVRPQRAAPLRGPGGRVAVVDGCRTPFLRTGTDFRSMEPIDLAEAATNELIARTEIDPTEIDLAVFGVVMPTLQAPNLGREVVLRTPLPRSIPGSTVNLACASSCRAIALGVSAILGGEGAAVLAGGAEALSNLPVRYSRNAARRLAEFGKAKTVAAKLAVLGKLRFKDLAPVPPVIAEESLGETMGVICERMAREDDVSRRAQDEIALLSHRRAAAARADGRLAAQIVTTYPRPSRERAVSDDNGIREDTSAEALAALPPVFDPRYGSLTAGNSSPLADGAGALLLMAEDKARALGYEPLAYVRSYAFSAVDPAGALLQAPVFAIPQALDRAGLSLADMALVEMHEAFGAQIVSNLKALASRRFACEELGRDEAVGEVDLERLNVTGGTLAFGHAFGATGTRMTLSLLYELRRRQENFGLLALCAAGGIGFAMVFERE